MRAETANTVEAIRKSLALLKQRMGWETARHRLEEFDAMIEDPNLWNDQERAQKLMRDRQILFDAIALCTGTEQELNDNLELIELGEMEDDQEVVSEAEAALRKLAETTAQKEIEALLNGEADGNDTYLEINSGAGGTDSCDWANMLARMYVRWAEKHGYKVELISETPGEEAGIKSAKAECTGSCGYRPMTARHGGTPRFLQFGSTRSSTKTSRSTFPPAISGLIPTGRRGRVGSMSTPPILRCGSRIFLPASW